MATDTQRNTRPWATFTLASMAQLMIILDASLINVALPTIQKALHFSPEDLQWVVNIYVLLFGGFLLLGGRAGDILGRRQLFIAGMVLFSLASLAGGFATSAGFLVTRYGFKPILGIGMILSTIGLAVLTRIRVDGTYPVDVLPGILLVAFGIGFIFVPLSIAAVQGVQPAEIGLASGLINASQQVGGAIGLAVLSTISTSHFNTLMTTNRGPLAYVSSLVGGFQYAFATSAAILVIGIMLTFVLLPGGRATPTNTALA